jgi:hypothetical protein
VGTAIICGGVKTQFLDFGTHETEMKGYSAAAYYNRFSSGRKANTCWHHFKAAQSCAPAAAMPVKQQCTPVRPTIIFWMLHDSNIAWANDHHHDRLIGQPTNPSTTNNSLTHSAHTTLLLVLLLTAGCSRCSSGSC